MRRKLAITAALAMSAGLFGTAPAQAQAVPATVIVTEGVGNVCEAADLRTVQERNDYGNKQFTTDAAKKAWCTYPGEGHDLAVNPGQSTHPQWWGPATGNRIGKWAPTKQGLFAPGVGPGANGPYSLEIKQGGTTPPTNVCVDSIEGPGCGTRLAGRLKPGPIAGHGAHAGGSTGSGSFVFTSATGEYTSSGTLGWEQSAATILPLQGTATYKIKGDPKTYTSTLVGFTSSRGAGNAGNAGVTDPTTGFQVEGMIVAF
ncbi:MAG: hypothetical protein ACLGH3_04680 [Actinomycetota bacterium]